MDPLDFLETAKDLAGGRREADWRSSVSRAYYAVYSVLCGMFRSGVESRLLANAGNKRRIAHDFVVRCLKNCSDDDVAAIGDKLGDLRKQRDAADYRLDSALGQNKANEACSNAAARSSNVSRLSAIRIGAAVTSLLEISPYGYTPPVER